MSRTAALAILLAACPAAPPEPPWDFGGFCQDFAEEGPDVEHVELHRGEVEPNIEDDAAASVIVEAGDYENLLARWGVEAEAVDFSTHQVIAVWAGVPSTCGLREERFRVMRIDGVAVVDLTVEDTSGACDAACDMSQALGAIVAFPKETRARGCSRVRDTCPE